MIVNERAAVFFSSLVLLIALFAYSRYYSTSRMNEMNDEDEYDADDYEYDVTDKSIDGSEEDYIELED